ncbi:MAG: hypothetical protein HYZ09_02790 [Candidatus Kerfeldbacteria bacterium]|nr:hypothetical protein [Candidatus Kerfeldbacteria bacterium]
MTTRARRTTRRTARRQRDGHAGSHTIWYGLGLVFLGVGLGVISVLVIFFEGRPLASLGRQPADSCPYSSRPHVWEDDRCYPATQADCALVGGIWGALGSGQHGCNFVADDAGERCQDSTECTSGHCLAILNARTRLALTESTGPIPADGMCAGFQRLRGCNGELQQGMLREVVCHQ